MEAQATGVGPPPAEDAPETTVPAESAPASGPGGHPPPSPLSGGYLLIVIGEPHSAEHKELILQRIAKGFLSWDASDCHVNLEKELSLLSTLAPKGEEARNGERLIQYASESLVTEVLVHPQVSTLLQCVRNLLSSFTRHRHILHAGYTFAGTGSWILQDGTFSYADLAEAFVEPDVQRVLRAYENSVSVDVHCCAEGPWREAAASAQPFSRYCRVRVNPPDVLTAGSGAISSFIDYVSPFVRPVTLESLLEPSDVVGNIRFSHPTLYVFPGGQGDAALFGINGFNMLVDGGYGRKACFWDFARHLDRLDAVLLTRLNNANAYGLAALLRRKRNAHVYPQIGHFFCNLQERKVLTSPDGDKDRDSLLVSLVEEGQEMVLNLRHLQLKPSPCYRDSIVEPVNLYHKVGHGKLDMYVISPARDSKEVKEFLARWSANDAKMFGSHCKKNDAKDFQFPLQNMVSICALLVWQPANPQDTITRLLFPGSTPQQKIFEGLDKIRHLEFLKHPTCTAKSLSPSPSVVGLNKPAVRKYTPTVIDKLLPGEGQAKSYSKTVPTTDTSKQHILKTATIPVAGGLGDTKVYRATTTANTAPSSKIQAQVKKIEKTMKTDKTEKSDKTEKTDISEKDMTKNGDSNLDEIVKEISKEEKINKTTESIKIKAKTRTASKSRERKPVKSGSIEKKDSDKKDVEKKDSDKKEGKTSPTTPKKSHESKINGVSGRSESATRTTTRTSSRSRRSPSATPAKSTKEANNRKVAESKVQSVRAPSLTRVTAKTTKKEDTTVTAKLVERQPISRRPKSSPTKAAKGMSPAKTSKISATSKAITGRKLKDADEKVETKEKTESAVVEITPESLARKPSKETADKENVISANESATVIDTTTSHETAVEIEEANVQQVETSVESTNVMVEGKVENGVDDEEKKSDGELPSIEGLEMEDEEDEYLVIEKEELYTEESMQDQMSAESHAPAGLGDRGISDEEEDGEDEKLKRDRQESEKSKDNIDDKPRKKSEPKLTVKLAEKEQIDVDKKESDPRKLSLDQQKIIVEGLLSPENKEKLAAEVQEIITSATEILKVKEEETALKPTTIEDSKNESQEAKDVQLETSPDKHRDDIADDDIQGGEKAGSVEVKEESQPDEKFSTTAESGATTAPTLPEDERIPLDEIKEAIEEKHVVEDTKEKEHQVEARNVPEQAAVVTSRPGHFDIHAQQMAALHRDIVKTPDEVADLPVDEEFEFDKEEVAKDVRSAEDLQGIDTNNLETHPQSPRDKHEAVTAFKDDNAADVPDVAAQAEAKESNKQIDHGKTRADILESGEQEERVPEELQIEEPPIVKVDESRRTEDDEEEKKLQKELDETEKVVRKDSVTATLNITQQSVISTSLEELQLLGHSVDEIKPSDIKIENTKYTDVEPTILSDSVGFVQFQSLESKPGHIPLPLNDADSSHVAESKEISTKETQASEECVPIVPASEPLEVVQEDVYLESSVEEEPIYGKTDAPKHAELVTVTPDSSPEGTSNKQSPEQIARRKSSGAAPVLDKASALEVHEESSQNTALTSVKDKEIETVGEIQSEIGSAMTKDLSPPPKSPITTTSSELGKTDKLEICKSSSFQAAPEGVNEISEDPKPPVPVDGPSSDKPTKEVIEKDIQPTPLKTTSSASVTQSPELAVDSKDRSPSSALSNKSVSPVQEPEESDKLKLETEKSEKTGTVESLTSSVVFETVDKTKEKDNADSLESRDVTVKPTELTFETATEITEEEREKGSTTPSITVTGCKRVSRQSQQSDSEAEPSEEDGLNRQDDVFLTQSESAEIQAAVEVSKEIQVSSEPAEKKLDTIDGGEKKDDEIVVCNNSAQTSEDKDLTKPSEIEAVEETVETKEMYVVSQTQEFIKQEIDNHTDKPAEAGNDTAVKQVVEGYTFSAQSGVESKPATTSTLAFDSSESSCEKEVEDATTSATVHRMLVTASSEDGGAETEVCAAGSITFSRSSSPSPGSPAKLTEEPSQSPNGEDTHFTLVSKSVNEEYVPVPIEESDGDGRKLTVTTTVSTYTSDPGEDEEHGEITKTVTTVTKVTTGEDGQEEMLTTTTEELLTEGVVTSTTIETKTSPVVPKKSLAMDNVSPTITPLSSTPEPEELIGDTQQSRKASTTVETNLPEMEKEKSFAKEESTVAVSSQVSESTEKHVLSGKVTPETQDTPVPLHADSSVDHSPAKSFSPEPNFKSEQSESRKLSTTSVSSPKFSPTQSPLQKSPPAAILGDGSSSRKQSASDAVLEIVNRDAQTNEIESSSSSRKQSTADALLIAESDKIEDKDLSRKSSSASITNGHPVARKESLHEAAAKDDNDLRISPDPMAKGDEKCHLPDKHVDRKQSLSKEKEALVSLEVSDRRTSSNGGAKGKSHADIVESKSPEKSLSPEPLREDSLSDTTDRKVTPVPDESKSPISISPEHKTVESRKQSVEVLDHQKKESSSETIQGSEETARFLLESAIVDVHGGIATVSKNATIGFDDAMSAGIGVLSAVAGIRKESVDIGRVTPGSDIDAEPSTPHSDISSGQMSRVAAYVSGSEGRPDSDDEVPGSPTSMTSHLTHSPPPPHFDFEIGDPHRTMVGVSSSAKDDFFAQDLKVTPQQQRRQTIASAMTSYYGDMPDDTSDVFVEQRKMSGDVKSDTVESQKPEHRVSIASGDSEKRNVTLTSEESESTSIKKGESSKVSSSLTETNKNEMKSSEDHTHIMSTSFYHAEEESDQKMNGKPVGAGASEQTFAAQIDEKQLSQKVTASSEVKSLSSTSESQSPEPKPLEKKDPIEGWGKPLGLPTPMPPTVNGSEEAIPSPKGTPQKKVASNKKLVDRKRPESPRKSNKDAKNAKSIPIYLDLTYVPHHGNSYYSSFEFFKRVRARYYVFSGIEPSREVYNALLEAKQTWEDKNLEVTIIPTYDTDTLGYWVAENEEALAKYKIDLSPSASRCTINLQDLEPSCSAYRLEF